MITPLNQRPNYQANTLNKLGATPSDIISILENLKRVGAIQVDLEII